MRIKGVKSKNIKKKQKSFLSPSFFFSQINQKKKQAEIKMRKKNVEMENVNSYSNGKENIKQKKFKRKKKSRNSELNKIGNKIYSE